MVVRFFHNFEDNSGLASESYECVQTERAAIKELSGAMSVAQSSTLSGVGVLSYS